MKDTGRVLGWAVGGGRGGGGRGIDEAGRVLGPTGNAKPLLHWSATAPTLGSHGRGLAQELTQGTFG